MYSSPICQIKSCKRAFCVLSGAKDRSYTVSRKSNAALLLPHVFAVSPLLRYSYKKIGGGGVPVGLTFRWAETLTSSALALTTNVFYHLRKSSRLPQKDPNVFYHLRTTQQKGSKIPLCFLSLTDHLMPKYMCFLSLTKKAGGEGGAWEKNRCGTQCLPGDMNEA